MTDHGFISLGKYSTARDSILHYLVTNEWGDASDGDVEAPTGWFARISNAPAEVHIPNLEITSVLSDWFDANPEVTDSEELRTELVGHFLVVENSQGFVSVEEFPTLEALESSYRERELAFYVWDSPNNGYPEDAPQEDGE